MNPWSLYERPAALIPFALAGRAGQVAVYYGANDDPVRAGFDALAGLKFDIELSRGYPVVHARIERYAGSGYRAWCGWIQIITSVYADSHDPATARIAPATFVDLAPSLEEVGIPFCSLGYLPQLFDAPCLNLGAHAELRWTADTFLTTVPARSRDEEIARLLGFRWGYTESNVPGQSPALLPLQVTDAGAWNAHLPYLRRTYSAWRFRAA
ncbi:MAG: hypothetical protein JXA74_05770 [Anaerolineae bacterium]|nr:hypothetical protein [Anaerolineae bacterium]